MKISITNLFKSIVAKCMPSVTLERKIDNVKAVVDRNKLADTSTVSIDDVIAVAKQKKIMYRVHY